MAEVKEIEKQKFTKEAVEKQLSASIQEAQELAAKLERANGTIGYLQFVLAKFDLPSESKKD